MGGEYSVHLAPWEIKTLLIDPAEGGRSEVREVSLLEG
jgi:hypothetical protein